MKEIHFIARRPNFQDTESEKKVIENETVAQTRLLQTVAVIGS